MILSDDICLKFREVAEAIVQADEFNERGSLYDDQEEVLNQLRWGTGLTDEQYERVVGIIKDSGDPDFRSPK
jgi:hypothetical protein